MTRTAYYTASSIDGFIATEDNSLDWLFRQDIDEHGPMHYEAFMAGIGAVAMGSTTYEWILDHESGSWPYRLPAWVFSSRPMPRVEGDIRHVSGEVATVHADMVEAAGGKDLWVVGGGDLVGQFHDAGLLDEVWVQWAPVTLGSGAPLLPRAVDLRLEELARNRDFACARYTVVRSSAQTA